MAPPTNDYSLPAHLDIRQQKQTEIPSCAKTCFEYYKSSAYTSCDPDDLSCLCSRYSSEGFTLGEYAYGCAKWRCSKDVSDEVGTPLYNICSGEKAAVKATHTTTIILNNPPSLDSTSTSSATSSASATAATTPQPASATIVDATSSSTPTRVSATAIPAVPTDDGSKQSTSLTTGQAVGISVAAMGGLCFAGALLWLLLSCKRRRAFKSPKARNDSFDFIDKGAPRHSPFRHGHAAPRGPLGGFAKPRVELDDGGALEPQWYERQNRVPSPQQHAAVQPPSDRSVSPASRSYDSLRTVSQLLPEKAGHTPPQPPYKSPRAASVFSTATIFEEDGKTPKLLSPATMLPMPVAPKPILKMMPRRPERPEGPIYSAMFSTSPVDIRNPQSVSSSPSKSVRKELTPSPLRHLPPPPPMPNQSSVAAGRPLSSEFRVSAHHSLLPPPSSVPSYLPEYYASSDSRSPTFDMIPPPRRRPVPMPSKPAKSANPPRSYRCSGGSETSFESTDPDEITPPEEIERHLSPVPEGDSPNNNVRYPKVPRSSNQAVPRSPQPTLSPLSPGYQHSQAWPLKDEKRARTPTKPSPSLLPSTPKTPLRHNRNHQPSLSGSTLAAKRLGSSAATSLSNGIHIRSPPNSQSSPLKGYGRPAHSNSTRGGRPQFAQQRKPSYAGTGYGPDPAYDCYSPRTPEMSSPGPKILRTDREVVLRSPLWEPKLTPSRRGEDLFLSVSLASPGMAPGGYGGMELGRR
jgi:hypothetical protein